MPAEATRQEVEFLARELGVTPPARGLDLPCGLGRRALGLAARGFRVTGVDISAAAIESARRDAGASTAAFTLGDMRTPPPDAPFDAAYCFGNSFGYTSHAQTRAFVRNVAQRPQ